MGAGGQAVLTPFLPMLFDALLPSRPSCATVATNRTLFPPPLFAAPFSALLPLLPLLGFSPTRVGHSPAPPPPLSVIELWTRAPLPLPASACGKVDWAAFSTKRPFLHFARAPACRRWFLLDHAPGCGGHGDNREDTASGRTVGDSRGDRRVCVRAGVAGSVVSGSARVIGFCEVSGRSLPPPPTPRAPDPPFSPSRPITQLVTHAHAHLQEKS